MKRTVLIFCLFILTAMNLSSQQNNFPVLTGPYLGQKPPGMIPELYTQGIVSTNLDNHSRAAFSPDGTELFLSCSGDKLFILYVKIENGYWTKPEKPEFCKDLECSNPVFSPDGKKLFFTSQVVESDQYYISLWYVEKTTNGWSKRKKIDSILNFGKVGYQVSISKDNTMYFRSNNEGGFGGGDIYSVKFINGEYSQPENLGPIINTDNIEASPFISSNESFLLFRRVVRKENGNVMDFFISFHKEDDSWSEPKCISEQLNCVSQAFWIGLSPDQEYIFFVKTNRTQTSREPSQMY